MRLLLTIIAFLSFTLSSLSQTFNGTGGNIPNLATTQTCFNATVTGVGVINATTGLASVCMNISHADVGDLEIVLRAPDGTVIPLTMQNGGSGNNFNTTCFSATATNPVKSGTAPFNGTYLPEGHLGAANNGQNANGVWSLCILDRRNNSGTGTVNSWSLTFGNNPAPPPPALPSCAQTLPASSSCATATLVCDFNGLCGSTAAPSIQTWPALTAASCFSLQNNSFIRFIASATTASFSVWIPTTIRANYLDGGLQMLFFSGNCGGPVTTYGCYEHIYPHSGTGQPTISVISASGLTPGNTYYLMIDGYNGDNCTFTIAANTGVNILNITPATPAVCTGGSINLTASGGNGVYSWSPATGLSGTSGTTVTATPAGTTTYTVTSTTPAGCPITKDVTVTVNPLPTTPTTSVTAQPTCSAPTGTITITAPLTAGLQYSVGGSYQGSPVFPGLTPGSYIVTVRDPATSCTSQGVPLTINPIPVAPAAPTVVVTHQPTCTAPTGNVQITAPTGAGYQYNINGGPYTSMASFAGLIPGNYTITVRDAAGCVSAGTQVTINPVPPLPPVPTFTTIQPNCLNPTTGTVTVTSPLGPQYLYSLPGYVVTPQASPVFNNVPMGNYPLIVWSVANPDCSSPAPVTIGSLPPGPQVPAGTIDQPTCTTPTGTITITSPAGPAFQYSINGGPYQSSPVFAGLTPNSYTITVRDPGFCTNTSQPFVVNPPTGAPATPTGTIVQPGCTGPTTGTITITAPTGAGLQYSINGGPYQASPVFSGLTPNSYTITVQNAAVCTSPASLPFVINTAATLAAPTLTSTPAQCGNNGTVTVISPLGADYEYSLDNGPYQSSPVFTGLAGNGMLYAVRVRSISTGCVSAYANITVNGTGVPAAISATATACTGTTNNNTGTITVFFPTGADFEYSLDGINYQSSPVFQDLPPGIYQVRYRIISSGCVSATQTLTVGGITAPLTFTFTNPTTCVPPNGTVTITSPVGPNYAYRLVGQTVIGWQSSPVFNNVPPGSYAVLAGLTNQPCMIVGSVTINPGPAAPPTPVVVVTQPACGTTFGSLTVTSPVGAQYQYSIGGLWSSSPVFPTLPPGTYTVTVEDLSGCMSAPSAPLTINPANPLPPFPTVAITQPSCTNARGVITVTSPLGANYEYSLSGGNSQASPIFDNLNPGLYSIRVRNATTGCLSQQLGPLTLNAAPATPVAPTLNTLQPNCIRPEGTITVTAPLGAGLEYSLNGGTYTTTTVFQVIQQGTYTIRVRNSDGCISAGTNTTINLPLAQPAKPVIFQTQPSCPTRVGAIRVDAPTGPDIEYSINGSTYQSSNIFPNLQGGTYNVTARFIGSTCVSQPTAVEIFGLTPEQCLLPVNGDIYFPSAFTPNGDGRNDGFGPGPRTNLANVTGYTLMLFNRYGEKVFETNDPLHQWNGTYKGKILANYSYTWVAKYRYGSRPVQMQKGSVVMVR